jgi:hypothetical protein
MKYITFFKRVGLEQTKERTGMFQAQGQTSAKPQWS